MKNDINLLPPAQIDTEKSLGTLKILKTLALSSLTAVLVISILLFFLSEQLSPARIKKKENELFYNMSFLQQKQAKLAIIKDRLDGISEIIKNRQNYDITINTFLKKVPDGVSINSISIDKSKVTLVVSSNSLLLINNFLNNLIDMAKKKQIIKDITVDTLTANVQNGTYSLSVTTDIL